MFEMLAKPRNKSIEQMSNEGMTTISIDIVVKMRRGKAYSVEEIARTHGLMDPLQSLNALLKRGYVWVELHDGPVTRDSKDCILWKKV